MADKQRPETQLIPEKVTMAPAPIVRRSARLRATRARIHDDDGDNHVSTTSDALQRNPDARRGPGRPRRSSKRARDIDAPERNTRPRRVGNNLGQTDSLGEQSTGSAASLEEGAAPNPSATPEPIDDTRMCNLLNSSMIRHANETIDAGHTPLDQLPPGDAASSPNNGDGGERDGGNDAGSQHLDADQEHEVLEAQEASPSQYSLPPEEREEDSGDSTPARAPGVASGVATLTTQDVNELYRYESTPASGVNADSEADVVETASGEVDSDVDFEVQSDIDEDDNLPLATGFGQDIDKFENRATAHFEDPLFIGPSNSSTTINLDPKQFLKVFRHMKRKGWTGVQQGWDTNLVQTPPKTTVGKVLTHFVRKIERLYRMGSGQPDITTQTAFFDEHTDPLKYYFGTVVACVDFIKDKRLPPDKTEPLNKAGKKRKEMAMDLANPLIPWLVRLLRAAWHLGGREHETFNDFTIQLLIRTVGWIRELYNTLQREIKDTPVPEKRKERAKPVNHPNYDAEEEKLREEEDEWRKWAKLQEARDQLDVMLKEFETLLEQAPDMLLAEEDRKAHLEAEKKRRREQAAQRAEQDRRDEEQRERERMLQNENVARSLRREAADGWHEVDVDYLRTQLQRATYDPPMFPSLQDTARRVGHSEDDTMEKSKKELRKMLGRMLGEVRSPKQIEAEVKSLMQLWRLRYP